MTEFSYNHSLLQSGIKLPQWWKSREQQIQSLISEEVRVGQVKTLSISPGGRKINAVIYGEAEPWLKGTANFNSAIGASMPEAYYRRGAANRERPVMLVLAGIHGQELEGMMGAVSLIRLMETGCDIMGVKQPVFYEKLKRLRLIIIPLANPDGRIRVPYDGWCGLPAEEMTRYGQGIRKSGEPYEWKPSKAIHPMKGDVGLLGGYFDDDGVNMMHDDWASPMSKTTKALLQLVSSEGPDMLLNLHSHSYGPTVLGSDYVPMTLKNKILKFAQSYYNELQRAGFASYSQLPSIKAEGPEGEIPPPFNLQSMFYHVGMDFGFTFESPHGVTSSYYNESFGYEEIIKLHHILFECSADLLLDVL